MRENNMNVSRKKTKTMLISAKSIKHKIELEGTRLQQVDNFKYLGSVVNKDGKIDQELNSRITAASCLFNSIKWIFLNKREVAKQTKIAVYKSTYVPTLSYSSEMWTMTQRQKGRLQAMEMRFLRKIEGKTLRDKVRSNTIRRNLKVESLQTRVEKGQLRWFVHIHRMDANRIPETIYKARASGNRTLKIS